MNAFAVMMASSKRAAAPAPKRPTKRAKRDPADISESTKAQANLFGLPPPLPRACEHLIWNRSSGLVSRCKKRCVESDPYFCQDHCKVPKGCRAPTDATVTTKRMWSTEVDAVEIQGRPWSLRIAFTDRLGRRFADLVYDSKREVVTAGLGPAGDEPLTREEMEGCRSVGFAFSEPFNWSEV